MSNWNIYLVNSDGSFTSDGFLPRSNQNVENNTVSTMQQIKLADGSNAQVFPEIKSSKNSFTMFIADSTSDTRTKIQGYIDNASKVKIVTHTGQEFIGYFTAQQRVWWVGREPDAYDLQLTFQETE
jgi:hypothetical protein